MASIVAGGGCTVAIWWPAVANRWLSVDFGGFILGVLSFVFIGLLGSWVHFFVFRHFCPFAVERIRCAGGVGNTVREERAFRCSSEQWVGRIELLSPESGFLDRARAVRNVALCCQYGRRQRHGSER
jgi:hypothetical protein